MAASATPASPARASPPRAFGRYELRQLLGKSAGTMAWLAFDPRLGQEVMLTLPRVQPHDAEALELRLREMKQAARLNHPNLAHVIEVGVQDHWPYLACDRALGLTLGEWLAGQPPLAPLAPLDVAGLVCQALRGLAFAHEAGVAHRDLQLHNVLVGAQGQVRLAAFGAVEAPPAAPEADARRAQRDDAERDVLAIGVLLHQMLCGTPVLDEADVSLVIARMPPHGRDLVRLPWTTPQPVSEGLRAIANRCTASQERQRYLNARTLLRALEVWREVEERGQGDPIALLIDRLHSVGHLPALPGISRRLAKLSFTDTQRTDEMAELLLQDIALSFELLRTVNSAQVRGTQVAGNGPVLTLRRAIALLGVDGVRNTANALRQWPGPMDEAAAAAMARLINVVRLAGHAAQALRPPGYDAEVVFLVAVMQNLGRLLVQYHFPDEAEQIRQLMQPLPPKEPEAPPQPGLSEESAAYAVLGVDIESLGAAVARHWGLGDEVQHMIRRLPAGKPVRHPDSDADMLRAAASAANEAVDAMTRLPAPKIAAAIAQVSQRYARVLELSPREVQEALQGARAALQSGTAAAAMPRTVTNAGEAAGAGPA